MTLDDSDFIKRTTEWLSKRSYAQLQGDLARYKTRYKHPFDEIIRLFEIAIMMKDDEC